MIRSHAGAPSASLYRHARGLTLLCALLGLCAARPAGAAPPAGTSLTWLGHAAFQIITPKGKVIYIDPWLKNPVNPAEKAPGGALAAVKRADFILLTHGHFDHVGDAVAIAKKTGAQLVTSFELGTNLVRALGFPKDQATLMTLGNSGGQIVLSDGEVTVHFTPAIHSSGLDVPPKGDHAEPMIYGGNPMGFVVQIKDGPTIYHSGDTAFFRDMELIGEVFAPDVALLNIGGHFGMEPAMAARAAAAVRARLVIPQHFMTFPVLTKDAAPFLAALTQQKSSGRQLQPGVALAFTGKTPQN